MSDEDGGLFIIAIDDSDDEGLISEEAAKAKERPRDWQSEEEFQELRATYRVNVQDGDVSYFLFPLAINLWVVSMPSASGLGLGHVLKVREQRGLGWAFLFLFFIQVCPFG